MTFQRGHKVQNSGKTRFKKGHKVNLGKKHPHSELTKLKIGKANKITWKVAERRKKTSGQNSNLWKGGVHCYDRMLWHNRKRRALKKKAEGLYSFEEWQELKKKYNFTCPACGKKEPEIKLSEDHIIPLSKGGTNYIDNIQPLCRSCNCRKYTKVEKYNYMIG